MLRPGRSAVAGCWLLFSVAFPVPGCHFPLLLSAAIPGCRSLFFPIVVYRFPVAIFRCCCRPSLPMAASCCFFRLSFPFCSYSVLSCPVSFPGSVEHLCNSNPVRQRETATGKFRLPLKEMKRNGEEGRVSKGGEYAREKSGGTKEFPIVSDSLRSGTPLRLAGANPPSARGRSEGSVGLSPSPHSRPARQRETATGKPRLPLKEMKRNGEGGRVSKGGEYARGKSGGTKEFSIVSDSLRSGNTPAPGRRKSSLCQREVGRECRFVSVSAFETSETKRNGDREAPIAVRRNEAECGDGGSRTLVQTRNPKAFYTFSRPFGPSFSARQAAA